MPKSVKPVPEGFHTVTTHLVVKDSKRALDFYKKAFGAEVKVHMPSADGRTMHAEMRIGDSVVMLADEFPQMSPKTRAPESTGGTVTASTFLYVSDVDASFKRAVDAGAKVEMPPTDMFWGDRYGKLVDPFGHQWGLGTHIEDVDPKEMDRRRVEFEKQMAQQHGKQH